MKHPTPIRELIERLVREKGLSLSAIAKKMDCSYDAVYSWYTGRRRKQKNPPMPMMAVLFKLVRKNNDE